MYSLNILENISESFDALKPKPMDIFFKLLNHPNLEARRISCSSILKILARNHEYFSLVVNNTIYLEKLICTIHYESNEVKFLLFLILNFFEIQNTSVKIISKLISDGSASHIETLLDFGIFDEFCQLIDVEKEETLVFVLLGLHGMLSNQLTKSKILDKYEVRNLYSLLKPCKRHHNYEIRETTHKICKIALNY